MCGKENPPDLEICQYCEARLKPLVGPAAEDDSHEVSEWSEPIDERLIPDGSAVSGTDLTDWLQSLRVDDEESSSGSPAEEDSLTWLPVEGIESQAEGDSRVDDGENDWLSNLRQEGDVTEEPYSDQDESAEGWEAPEEPSEDLPSWLSSIDEDSADEDEIDIAEPQADDGVEPSEIEESETPEWLRKVRALQEADETGDLPIESPVEHEAEDVPFWMEESKEPTLEEDQQDPDVPDWLSDLSAESTEADSDLIEDITESETSDVIDASKEKVEAISSQPFTEEDVPGWLSDLDGQEVDQAIDSDLTSDEVPDWLSKLEEAAGIEQQPDVSTPEDVPIIDIDAVEEGDSVPSQLLFEDEEFATGIKDEELVHEIDEEEGTPETEVQAVAPFSLDEETEGVNEDDLSDLLSEIPEEEIVDEVDESQIEDDELAPAELPVWLEAMRPVESAAPITPVLDESDQVVEGGGPLAGLRGVIPAEPGIARLKKPTVYTSKLQVSENHRLHATILSELIKNERRTQPLPTSPVLSSQQILRWSIFALLSIAILWFVFTGSQNVPLPALSSSVLDVSNIINKLPENSPVLLAVDYEPGISGEMDAASAGVMDHLMIKGSYLTLVSTAVTGPAQAERLLNNVNSSMGHQYQGPDQYRNLGFIPGGATGLAGFAEAPRQYFPYSLDIDGNSVWESGALSGVQSLADFMLVLVITESPDTAIAWIEQVQPSLDSTPLVMVISAQAQPMVQPYYQGTPQQVQGIVTGLAGGAAYESGLPRTSLARSYWDAYSFVVWLAVLLIIVGGGVNIASSLISERKRAKGEVGR
jgi:hypothetical protein